MTLSRQLFSISRLNGQFTESVLVNRGISHTATSRALSVGLLKKSNSGILSTVPTLHRTKRLAEAVAVDMRPGSPVSILDRATKQLMSRQVVQVNGTDVYVVDPTNPQAQPEKVSAEDIATSTDQPKDNSNTGEEPKPVSPPTGSSSPVSANTPSSPTIPESDWTGSPFDNKSLVDDGEDEYATVDKYFEMVMSSPEFSRGLERLRSIGATTYDIGELIEPLTPEEHPELYVKNPRGNAPIDALIARLRDAIQEGPQQDVHHLEQSGATEREWEDNQGRF
jgi:hypothetical protein